MKALFAPIMAFAMSALPAAAVTVDFALETDGVAYSSGSFSYDDSLDGGVIGFADLDSFVFNMAANSYDLAWINSTPMSVYFAMAFDSATDMFNSQTIAGFPTIMAAIASDFSAGFFVRPLDNIPVYTDYGPGSTQLDKIYTSIAISVDRMPAAVPLPAGGVLLLTGLGAFALARRRKAA